jgi:FKBP-type peptidyl-prolyl cis-trans isomerase SlyD
MLNLKTTKTMQIGQNKVVSVTYKLESSQGDNAPAFVEETNETQPLIFLFGSGQLIPDFEKNLEGLTNGMDFTFKIQAENAYGEVDDEAVVTVSNEMFKTDGILDLEVLRIGNTVPLLDREGNQFVAKILSMADDTVTLDFNHPLAGHNLHFSGKVVDIREASEEELSHGHAHGDGTHHH